MATRGVSSGTVLLAMFLIGGGWLPGHARTLGDVAFMSGCWRGQVGGGNGWIEERYGPPQAGMMLGTSHTVENEKTSFFEFIQITEAGGEVEMNPLPRGKKSVPFRLVKMEGKKATFENLQHDFPKRIVYQLKDDGSLFARVEGDKPEQTLEFLMKPCG